MTQFLFFLFILGGFQSLEFRPGETSEVGRHNLQVFQSMVDLAKQDVTLNIQEGLLYIEATPEDFGIILNRGVKIKGCGKNRTILKFGPDNPMFSFYAFYIDANGYYLFEDLTIRGPDDPGPNGPDNTITYGIYSANFENCILNVNQVSIDGHFTNGIGGNRNSQPGRWWYYIDHTEITADMTGVNMFCSYPDASLGVRMNRVTIYDCGFPATETTPARGAFGYFHPKVSTLFEDCEFYGNQRYGIQHTGSSNPDIPPFDIEYRRCRWWDVRTAMLTSDTGKTRLVDCNIEAWGEAVLVRNDIEVIRTKISAGNICVQNSGVDRPLRAYFENCDLSGKVMVLAGGNGARWIINNTRAVITVPAGYAYRTVSNHRPSVEIHGGEITTAAGLQGQTGVYPKAGFWKIDGVTIAGNFLYAGIMPEPTTEKVEVLGCLIDTPNTPAIRQDYGEFWIDRLRVGTTTIPPPSGTW